MLQGGKHTAGEIAQRFEVSIRTIQRDIDALCEIGIPVIAEVGTCGGYSLPPDYSLPPLALTLHEALLLRLALTSLSQLSETPFKQERESLLSKVQTLLPRHRGEDLNQLQQALSFTVPSRSYPTPFLERLLESAQTQQWLSVIYHSEKGISSQTLLPRHIYTETGLWYCEAYSSEREAVRIYRVDRFQDVHIALSPPSPAQPAHPLLHVHDSFPEVRIQLTARGILRLEREQHLASHIQQQADQTGILQVHLQPEDYDWLTRILLSLGTDAQVLAPDALRQHVQQVALEIARHYTEL